MAQRSERCLELRLKEAEGCRGWRSLYATSRSWKVNVVKRKPRVSMTMEEGNKARFEVYPWEAIWHSLIDPERPGENHLASGPSLSDAGELKVYLQGGKTLSVMIELSGGEEVLVGGSGPAAKLQG